MRLQQMNGVEESVMLHRDLLIEFGARQDATDETLPRIKRRFVQRSAS